MSIPTGPAPAAGRPSRSALTRRVRGVTTAVVAAGAIAVGGLAAALGAQAATAQTDTPQAGTGTRSDSVTTTPAEPGITQPATPGGSGSLQSPRQRPGAASGRADAGTGGS